MKFIKEELVFTATRIALGILWLYAGLEKVITELGGKMATSGFLSHDFSTFGFLFRWMSGNPLIDGLVVFGEVAIGIALILGLFTKLGAYMGALQSTLFAIATYPSTKETVTSIFGTDTFYALLMLMIAVFVPYSNYYSLDSKLQTKMPKLVSKWLM